MKFAMEIAFWFFLFLIGYTYMGYPLILLIISKLSHKPVRKGSYEPKVSVILSACNEEKFIERKLHNLLEIDYPEDKIEILVGSDGASDETDQIVSGFHSPRIRFFRFVKNLGKPNVLNALVKEAHHSILVLTDSRQTLEPHAIRKLVENFCDPGVGCVSGELFFKKESDGRIEEGMDAYWRYEKFLRKCESKIGSMLGATGAFYAVRKHLMPVFPKDVLVDDMYAPLSIVGKGYRAVFESEAKIYDKPSTKSREEFTRKTRTLAGNFQIFLGLPKLFIPFKSSIAWQLFSHKFLRLMVPYFLAALLIANLFLLDTLFYQLFLVSQILFYSLAALEAIGARMGWTKRGIGYLPYMFCLLNYCALIGLTRFLSNQDRTSAWEKAYA